MSTLTAQAVQTAVERAVDATITACTAIDKGTDIVYRLEGTHNGTTQTYFFKTADQNHAEAFRSEPLIQHYINTQTDLPTADIVAFNTGMEAADTPLNRPYFVMNGLPGEHPDATEWPQPDLESAAFQMGQALGQIHDSETFATAGEVFAKPTDPHGGIDEQSPIPLEPGGYDSWAAMLTESIRPLLKDAEQPFDTYTQDIIDYYDAHHPDIPNDDEITLTLMHGDYRFDNVLFDHDATDSPQLTGVLDWGRTVAGDRRYNLIRTAYLLDREADTPIKQEQLRDHLYHGYNETNTVERGHLFADCLPLYTLHVMAVEFKWFSQWYAGQTDEWKQNRRQYLQETLEAIIAA